MAVEFTVYNVEGKKEGTVQGNEKVFATVVNRGLLHTAVLWYLANRRSGTANTKTKGEVAGGGKKPMQQKGTGNARMGSRRSPLNPGGGVAFGPKPRSFAFNFPKTMREAALRSALTSKAKSEKLAVLSATELKEAKTKLVQKFVNAVKVQKNVLIVDDVLNETFAKASRNIPNVKAISLSQISVYDVLKYDNVFLTKSAVKKLEEKLA